MRIFRLLLAFTLVFIMTSCTQVIKNPADEIRLASWKASLKNGERVKLDFDEDNVNFIILNSKNKSVLKLSGKAFFDRNRMMIFDRNDSQSYVFNYKLRDNKLELNYGGGKITLKREGVTES